MEKTAVYLGMERRSRDGRVTFRCRFWLEGAERALTAEEGGTYPVRNALRHGAVYRLRIQGEKLTALCPLTEGDGIVTGRITALERDCVTIGTRCLALAPGAEILQITQAPGEAMVAPVSLALGDGVQAGTEGGRVRAIYKTCLSAPYKPPVRGTPGLRTMKNLLATAMEPVGAVLYVYGGGWNWQDTGASSAVSLGLDPAWTSFFQRQSGSYDYRAGADPIRSYYPWDGRNHYGYAGLDCSGYLGWVLSNTLGESGGEGFVMPAAAMARALAERDWGRWSRETDLRPGDIVSIPGHVWLSLGTCGDGSAVLAHSTPSPGHCGGRGGGVQLSALGEDRCCRAYALVKAAMGRFYPAWSRRYAPVLVSRRVYTDFTGPTAGRFRWQIDGVLTDPDGYVDMTPGQILRDLLPGWN